MKNLLWFHEESVVFDKVFQPLPILTDPSIIILSPVTNEPVYMSNIPNLMRFLSIPTFLVSRITSVQSSNSLFACMNQK